MASNPFAILPDGSNFDYQKALADYNKGAASVASAGGGNDVAGSATTSAIASGRTAAAQLPGYMTSLGNIGKNIRSETAGQVPDDVISLLKQEGAESNVTTGAASNAAYLRSLGLTSLGLKDEGQKNFESILPSLPGYSTSQNPEFQTSSNLAYEKVLQPQVWQRQDQQQQFELQQQAQALATAKEASGGGGWAPPTNAWSGSYFTPAGTNLMLSGSRGY